MKRFFALVGMGILSVLFSPIIIVKDNLQTIITGKKVYLNTIVDRRRTDVSVYEMVKMMHSNIFFKKDYERMPILHVHEKLITKEYRRYLLCVNIIGLYSLYLFQYKLFSYLGLFGNG